MSELTSGYLKIKDIKGESKHTKYVDCITILTMDHIITNSASMTQKKGLCAGTPYIGEMIIQILYDKSSTALRDYLIKGKHIQEAKLDILRSSSKDEEEAFHVFTMTNVLITACNTTYDAFGSSNSIFIKLSFEQYLETYTGQKFDGTPDASVSCGYNVATKKIS
ncbi:Hcp family type VI secretion system effector [Xenorhabdus lircayensis]|uniref:Type VI secretion system tube protein Hcp n=1 Tax=Xenorhabdus lircayensis TaxID=2763499 RepID=A0ABS0U907_9GAMM|nr:type VI secretion system tube protein Hcp [Xenorhabdus lircayensis]MBI6550363.1 type VI secretion system tube protein Hcp [Xenorhabdus lircayensis]